MSAPALRVVYDPREAGSKCDLCPLGSARSPFRAQVGASRASAVSREAAAARGAAGQNPSALAADWTPVPGEYNGSTALALGEAPGGEEEAQLRPFCLDGDTLVLMADLTWRPLRAVKVGECIVSVDENPTAGAGVSGFQARRWQIATVTATHRRYAATVRVTTPTQELIGTEDHRVLARGARGNLRWVELGRLLRLRQAHGGHATRLLSIGAPWTRADTYEAGWLGGFLDGEGHVLGSKSDSHRKSAGRVGFSQNMGPLFDRATRAVLEAGFQLRAHEENRAKGVVCGRVLIAGPRHAAMRFLGTFRPERLIANFRTVIARGECRVRDMCFEPVLSREPLGEREVFDLTTTTGTYIANGVIVHNCGPSGNELEHACVVHGVQRHHLDYDNALACVQGQEFVRTLGGKVRIADLVRNRFAGKVRCLLPSGRFGYRRVVGWHKTPLGDRQLLKLTTASARTHRGGGSGPVLTNDHPVLTRTGWKRVDALSSGEPIATDDVEAIGIGAAVVIGSLLGDGHILRGAGVFKVGHTAVNEDYLRLKAQVLAAAYGARVTRVATAKMAAAGTQPRFDCATRASRWFRLLRRRFYPAGRKVVPEALALDAATLAIWFLDDGHTRLRTKRAPLADFATCGFERDDVERLVTALRPFGIAGRVVWHKHWRGRSKRGGYWRIKLGAISTERLASVIAPYVPPSMQYKLPLFWRGRFDPKLWAATKTRPLFDASVVSVAPPSRTKWQKHVFCLDVEDAHNFVTGGGVVVHNCRPPKNDLTQLLQKITRHNAREKKREAEAKHEGRPYKANLWLTPQEACRPRLLRIARRYSHLLLLGGTATKAFLGDKASIMELRGGPCVLGLVEGGADPNSWFIVKAQSDGTFPAGLRIAHRWNIVPSLHPALVLRQRRWRRAFHADLGRAFRFFAGELRWRDPLMKFQPTPEELEAFLFSGRALYVVDLETLPQTEQGVERLIARLTAEEEETIAQDDVVYDDGDTDGAAVDLAPRRGKKKKKKDNSALDPLRARLGCIGIGDEEIVYVVGYRSKETGEPLYSGAAWRRIVDILRRFFTDVRTLKGGWHVGSYDRMVIERGDADAGYIGVRMWPLRDGILDHRLVESDLPHKLGFVASIYEDVGAWKAAHSATDAETDLEWWRYNGLDVAVTARLMKRLAPAVAARRQEHLVAVDHAKQSMCVGFHKAGMLVDQRVRGELEIVFKAEKEKWIAEARRIAEWPTLNPASTQQVAELLFDRWELPVYEYTGGGEPSTNEDVLIQLFTDPAVAQWQRQFIRALRKVRKSIKKLGTYVYPYRTWADGGMVWPDGRIRGSWNAHVTPTGRLSSSDPNLQNVPGPLRVMMKPAPGHVYVSADKDQVELRIASALAQCVFYLDVFAKKQDPHGLLCEMVWGDVYRNSDGYVDPRTGKKPKKGSAADRLRDLAKRVVYASLYAANDETVHEQIVQAEDANEELIYAEFSLQQVKAIRQAWFKLAPEFPRWWVATTDFWRTHGYVESAILHRRRDCLDSTDEEEELNTLVNHPVQSTAADDMSICEQRILARYPFDCFGPSTGLIHQGHDSLTMEVPEARAEEVCVFLTEAMTTAYRELPGVVLTAEADIDVRWAPLRHKPCGKYRDVAITKWNEKAEVCDCDGGRWRVA